MKRSMKPPITLEASIDELTSGGDGVALADIEGERRAIFVGGAARGERVRIEVDPTGRPARGRLLAVLEPSTARVNPACPHVAMCGGCDWMHLAPAEQVREHAVLLAKLLHVDAATVRSHPAAQLLGYRTRARLHVEARRGRVVVGMFGRRSHEPVPVDRCVVLHPSLDELRERLPTWLAGAAGRGEAHVSLGSPAPAPDGARLTDLREGVSCAPHTRLGVLDLRWGGDLPAEVFGRLERAVQAHPAELAGARVFAGDVRVPASIGDPTPFIVGADGELLRLAPGGFSQATEEGNVLLARRVAELAGDLPPGPCVELHAGAGNHTVVLARMERDIVAVERDPAACAAARSNLAARGLSARVRVVEGDADSFPLPKGTKLVVLDPPREGARAVAATLAAVAAKSPQKAPSVVYVSCDPPTLARDVRTLGGAGYAVRAVETFEMFPHTSHVETVVVLTRQG
jgi:23S rRNA (uracil1939-C5)-methyltransferase